MAKVSALKSFAGVITMYKGEVRELPESAALRELIACGYVAVLGGEAAQEDKKSEAKQIKPKGGKRNDTKSGKRK